MAKIYSAEEVARAVLNRCKELAEQNKMEKKEENCEDIAEKEVEEHEEEMHDKKKKVEKCGDMNKSSHKLKEFVKKKKKTDLKKMFGRTATSAQGGGSTPPPAPAPGTSIADQIGFGKKEVKKCGTMKKARGSEMEGAGDEKDPVRKEEGTQKAVGLKPLASDKVKPPSADQMPEKPKAATTLKNFMAKRKK
jgi:hypothetical protein